jgi:glucose-6-phosphate-specific signal transduction histidine kinase
MELHVTSTAAQLRRHADVAGATASGFCLVHCLLTPLVISAFPGILPYIPGDAWFHRLLALGIVLLGAVAFVPGYRIHRRKSLLLLIGAGMAFILVVAWVGEGLNGKAELAISITGSLMLVTAHLLNRSFCRQCITCSASTLCETTKIHS